jgi:hypothetical protein
MHKRKVDELRKTSKKGQIVQKRIDFLAGIFTYVYRFWKKKIFSNF